MVLLSRGSNLALLFEGLLHTKIKPRPRRVSQDEMRSQFDIPRRDPERTFCIVECFKSKEADLHLPFKDFHQRDVNRFSSFFQREPFSMEPLGDALCASAKEPGSLFAPGNNLLQRRIMGVGSHVAA